MKQLEHDNILPFYGVVTTVSDFSLVFPWYKNGNIDQYLRNNPGVDRCGLASTSKPTAYSRHLHERHEQLLGAANGLLFLHSNGLVHGDLKLVCGSFLSPITFNATNRATY